MIQTGSDLHKNFSSLCIILRGYHYHQSCNPRWCGCRGTTADFDSHSPSIFVVSCTLQLCKRRVSPFWDVIFSPLLLSASVSSFLHYAFQDDFSQAWWSCHMSISYHVFFHKAKQAVMWPKGCSYSFSDHLICDVIFVWSYQDYQMRKFSAKIRWWTHRTTIALLYLHRKYWYWWKLNTQSTSWCMVWSLAMTSFIFPNGNRFKTEVYIKCLEEVVLVWSERVAAGRLCLTTELYTLPHKQENPALAVKKFLQPHHP